MRAIGALLFAMSTFLAVPNALAQAYDPAYPFCQQSYGIGGTSISCSFTSLAQCQATASGRAAQCLTNPYFNFSKTRRP